MKEKTKKIGIYILVVILIIIDQIVKYVIEYNKGILPIKVINNFLQISYCENTGIAFGIGVGNIIVFIISNIIILAIIAKFIIGQSQRLDNKNKFVLSLVLSGGISNLIDRVARGYVVDYIDVNKFAVFNFADILICIGVIGFGISALKYISVENKQKNNT